MRRSWSERISEKIRLQHYTMTGHAAEEKSEDELTILHREHACLHGRVVASHKAGPQGA